MRVVVEPIPKMGPRGDRDTQRHPYNDYHIHVVHSDNPMEVSILTMVHKISGFDNWWVTIMPKDQILEKARDYARNLAKKLGCPGIVILHEPLTLREYVECDCTCADECPQGKMGSQTRCRVLKKVLSDGYSTPIR